MRRLLFTIRLWIALIAYGCFAIFGVMPHRHHHESSTARHLPAVFAMQCHSTGQAISNSDADADHCPICIAQKSFAACTALAIPALTVAYVKTPDRLIADPLALLAVVPHRSSRAPPTQLS